MTKGYNEKQQKVSVMLQGKVKLLMERVERQRSGQEPDPIPVSDAGFTMGSEFAMGDLDQAGLAKKHKELVSGTIYDEWWEIIGDVTIETSLNGTLSQGDTTTPIQVDLG